MKTDKEMAAYVEEQLAAVVPDGWSWYRERFSLRWRIEATSARRHAPTEDYWLHVSADLKWVMIFFGNSDAGAFSLSQELMNAKVIRVEAFDIFPLSTVVGEVMLTCEHNSWGLT